MSQTLIHQFYDAFARKDWAGMQACYHPEVTFQDPVFPGLKANEAKAMWHMLVLSGKNLVVTHKEVTATDTHGSCTWEATYSFSRTGRKVHNVIHAEFTFRDGRIVTHVDDFDLWKWMRMALGPIGVIAGWSGWLRNKIQQTAAGSLRTFIRSHPEYEVKIS